MQRMISHDPSLPRCADGHPARHMHDLRGLHCGGGHFVECACRATWRFPDFAAALRDWHHINGITATPVRAQVLPLRAVRAEGGAR